MNGRGRKRMSNGDVYWRLEDDKAHGFGIKKFACGDRHEGEYMEDRRCGYGYMCGRMGIDLKGNGRMVKCPEKALKL